MARFSTADQIDGKYSVSSIIGQGGMGEVLEVRDNNGQSWALKYCLDFDPLTTRRFAREIRIMAGIKHKHVVQVVDHNLEHDPPYFVMPLATGTLEEELNALSQDEDAAIDAFLQICRGIEAIHNSEAVHRDIKPGNALRIDDGTVVVSDLGLAKLHDRDSTMLTQANDFIGTRVYCAPEQLVPDGSRNADERTDIFQLGKTLYHLVTGKTPALIDPNLVHAYLAHIIRKATRDNPRERYANIGELFDAINIYRQSKDPARNPRQSMEALIRQAQDNLSNNQYDSANLSAMLGILATTNHLSNESLLDLFDNIPEPLLEVMAREFDEQFEPVLKRYVDALVDIVDTKPYPYAETVAQKMRLIFKNADHIDNRVRALEATLVAAVRLNRFAAMDSFNSMLQDVNSEEDMAVADMLRTRKSDYVIVYGAIPADRLYPAIRSVRNVLEAGIDAEIKASMATRTSIPT